jgi:hypothetical protein
MIVSKTDFSVSKNYDDQLVDKRQEDRRSHEASLERKFEASWFKPVRWF